MHSVRAWVGYLLPLSLPSTTAVHVPLTSLTSPFFPLSPLNAPCILGPRIYGPRLGHIICDPGLILCPSLPSRIVVYVFFHETLRHAYDQPTIPISITNGVNMTLTFINIYVPSFGHHAVHAPAYLAQQSFCAHTFNFTYPISPEPTACTFLVLLFGPRKPNALPYYPGFRPHPHGHSSHHARSYHFLRELNLCSITHGFHSHSTLVSLHTWPRDFHSFDIYYRIGLSSVSVPYISLMPRGLWHCFDCQSFLVSSLFVVLLLCTLRTFYRPSLLFRSTYSTTQCH